MIVIFILYFFLFFGFFGQVQAKKEELAVNLIAPDIALPTRKQVASSSFKEENPVLEVTPKEKSSQEKKEEQVLKETDNKKPKDILFDFEKADLTNFIKYIGDMFNINIFLGSKDIASAKTSISMRQPVDKEGAWEYFRTILESEGFTVVERSHLKKYDIISNKEKAYQPLDIYLFTPLSELPTSDISVRYCFRLQNTQYQDLEGVLKNMLSPTAQVIPIQQNGAIITEKAATIKSAMEVIYELDKCGYPEVLRIITLSNINVTEAKPLLESLISRPADQSNPLARLLGKKSDSLEYFPSSVKIFSQDERNRLILLGTENAIQVLEDFITQYLDKKDTSHEPRSPIRVIQLEHIEAAQVKGMLETLVNTPLNNPVSKYGGVRNGIKYFEKTNFQVDPVGNKLLISTTNDQDFELIRKTVKDLDKPQPQINIEALIVTVDIVDNKELGAQIRTKTSSTLGTHTGYQSAMITAPILGKGDSAGSLLGNIIDALVGYGRGSTVLSFGNTAAGNVHAVFAAFMQETNATILSRPFITVANRVSATIQSGSQRRVVDASAISDSGSVGQAQSYKYVPVSTKLTLTPQINSEGIINLTIDFSQSDFTDPEGGNTIEKDIKTTVSVANGQVIVTGGFVKTNVAESVSRDPFLGNIPIIGWFFKYKTRQIIKQYLFVFICPTIEKPRSIPGINPYTKIKLHEATQNVEEIVQVRKEKDIIHNWFFNPDGETYSHKVIDFANARYQPTTVDIKNDPYYQSFSLLQEQVNRLEKEQAQTDPIIISFDKSRGSTVKKVAKAVESVQKEAKFEEVKKGLESPLVVAGNQQKVKVSKEAVVSEKLNEEKKINSPSQVVQKEKIEKTEEEFESELAQRRAQLRQLLASTPPSFVKEKQIDLKAPEFIPLAEQAIKEKMLPTPAPDIFPAEKSKA